MTQHNFGLLSFLVVDNLELQSISVPSTWKLKILIII